VDDLELKRTRLDEAWFLVALEDTMVAGSAETIAVLEAKDSAHVAEQRKLAQSKPHEFVLSPE
jgi:hypothetical protein